MVRLDGRETDPCEPPFVAAGIERRVKRPRRSVVVDDVDPIAQRPSCEFFGGHLYFGRQDTPALSLTAGSCATIVSFRVLARGTRFSFFSATAISSS